MGEYAEMMLDGTCCSSCGEYLGGDTGYPMQCAACRKADKYEPNIPRYDRTKIKQNSPRKSQVSCPVCKRVVKKAGLGDHVINQHPETQADVSRSQEAHA